MASIGSSIVSPLGQPENPKVYNVSVALANTEVSQALTADTKAFTIRVRGSANLKLAFTATESATTFITIPRGANYGIDGLKFNGTLYFQTDKASQTVEILEWS